jgi:signal transduction histidine kinase
LLKFLNNYLKSFSFRVGAIIFVILCITLLSIRVFIFYKTLQDEELEIRNIIKGYSLEIDQLYHKHGAEYVANSIENFAKEMRDGNLILVFQQDDEFFGSYDKFPELPLKNNEWFSFKIKRYDAINKVEVTKNYLAKIIIYGEMENLVVAYNTQKLEAEKETLPKILLQYVGISTAVSLIISFAIIWLLNRYLQRFNFAYNTIKKGNLNYRIKTNNYNDQFDILSQNFNSLMEWLATLLNTIKDTTNSLAHDLRTPLSRHRLSLESILNQDDLPKKTEEEIQNSITEIDRVMKIFNNILSIAKAESKSGVENFKSFSLTELVTDLAEFFEPLVEENEQTLKLNIPENNIEYTGEPKLLTQAIFNLIDNAIKYNKQNGQVEIALEKRLSDNKIITTILDEGTGIPEEFAEKVKEKFFRLDKSRTSEGIGLGLSLVDSVIKLHNGELIIANRLDSSNNVVGLTAKIIL